MERRSARDHVWSLWPFGHAHVACGSQ